MSFKKNALRAKNRMSSNQVAEEKFKLYNSGGTNNAVLINMTKSICRSRT